MGVDRLRLREHQPFYHVLVCDGSSRYAAQENLQPVEIGLDVSHPEVGRHFSRREGTRYRLNTEAAARYPEDEHFRQRFCFANQERPD